MIPAYYCVKEAVFPFVKFPGVDPLLGPEMKSTGEVMGVGRTFGGVRQGPTRRGRPIAAVDKPSSACAMSTNPRRSKSLANWNGSVSGWSPPKGTAAALHAFDLACDTVHKVGKAGRMSWT